MAHRGGRKSIKGKHAKSKKFKRRSYTYEEKHQVNQCYAAGWSIKAISEQLLRGEKTEIVSGHVHRWGKDRLFIEMMASNVRTARMERHRNISTGTTLSFAAERDLVIWINSLRDDGVPVSSKMLSLQAVEVAEACGIPTGSFTASHMWIASFLRRHRLSFRTRNRAGQASPDKDDAARRAFAKEVKDWMHSYGATRVYNADQTGVFFEMLPKKTVASKGEQTVWVKCGKKEQERATAMLLGDSDGTKYPPFIVFKNAGSKDAAKQDENRRVRHGFSKRMWPGIQAMQSATGAQVYGNPTAWWNADLTIAWIDHFFGNRDVHSEPVLLLLDSFSGHWTSEVKEHAAKLNVVLKAAPPKLTWKCQPADVAWIKPLKDGLRQEWVSYLRRQLAGHKRGERFIMKPPGRKEIAEWIVSCWNRVSTTTIINGFIKCGFLASATESPGEDECEPMDANELVEQMEALGLLDEEVGEVYDEMDVLDSEDDEAVV